MKIFPINSYLNHSIYQEVVFTYLTDKQETEAWETSVSHPGSPRQEVRAARGRRVPDGPTLAAIVPPS